MSGSALPTRRPFPTLATAAFVVALVATAAYFAGLVPGVPKTLATFTNLLAVTAVLFVVAVLTWAASLAEG
jgi:uncharacterized membrane protein